MIFSAIAVLLSLSFLHATAFTVEVFIDERLSNDEMFLFANNIHRGPPSKAMLDGFVASNTTTNASRYFFDVKNRPLPERLLLLLPAASVANVTNVRLFDGGGSVVWPMAIERYGYGFDRMAFGPLNTTQVATSSITKVTTASQGGIVVLLNRAIPLRSTVKVNPSASVTLFSGSPLFHVRGEASKFDFPPAPAPSFSWEKDLDGAFTFSVIARVSAPGRLLSLRLPWANGKECSAPWPAPPPCPPVEDNRSLGVLFMIDVVSKVLVRAQMATSVDRASTFLPDALLLPAEFATAAVKSQDGVSVVITAALASGFFDELHDFSVIWDTQVLALLFDGEIVASSFAPGNFSYRKEYWAVAGDAGNFNVIKGDIFDAQVAPGAPDLSLFKTETIRRLANAKQKIVTEAPTPEPSTTTTTTPKPTPSPTPAPPVPSPTPSTTSTSVSTSTATTQPTPQPSSITPASSTQEPTSADKPTTAGTTAETTMGEPTTQDESTMASTDPPLTPSTATVALPTTTMTMTAAAAAPNSASDQSSGAIGTWIAVGAGVGGGVLLIAIIVAVVLMQRSRARARAAELARVKGARFSAPIAGVGHSSIELGSMPEADMTYSAPPSALLGGQYGELEKKPPHGYDRAPSEVVVNTNEA